LTRDEETWRMQNPDQFRLCNRSAARDRFSRRIAHLEVLVALRQRVEVKSVGCIGEKNLRPHFRVDRLRVHVGEGDAENERTQIIDIRNAAEISERTLCYEPSVFAALVLRWVADATIHHPHVVKEYVRAVARAGTEVSAF